MVIEEVLRYDPALRGIMRARVFGEGG